MAKNKFNSEDFPELTPALLKEGIKFHLNQGWPGDFHAQFYHSLRALQPDMFTEEWWVNILKGNKPNGNLNTWLATRNPGKGISIEKEGRDRLKKLSQAYNRILSNVKKPNMESCKWEHISGLFDIAMEIKPTKGKSAVFASKLCHFILPPVFPVVDNEGSQFVPVEEVYPDYYETCRKRWKKCDCKEELIEILRKKILSADKNTDLDGYPWALKITNLCF